MGSSAHKGWHSRGYLPHLDSGNELQAITFRLEDSLPQHVIDRWKEELNFDNTHNPKAALELRSRIDRYEDEGHGACLLKEPACAEVVQSALLFFDPDRYRVLEWCIMPNHIHVLLHLCDAYPLGEIVKSWKRFTAQEINRICHRNGPLWAVDYHDRYIRDEKHLTNARSYIRQNPVKAGLCRTPESWPWSSASHD